MISLSPLEIFFIISGVIILIVALDAARRDRFNALHFIVFLGVGVGLLVFSFLPGILDWIGDISGLERGADALVYAGIVFLVYFSLLLLQRVDALSSQVTILVREMALQNAKHAKNQSK